MAESPLDNLKRNSEMGTRVLWLKLESSPVGFGLADSDSTWTQCYTGNTQLSNNWTIYLKVTYILHSIAILNESQLKSYYVWKMTLCVPIICLEFNFCAVLSWILFIFEPNVDTDTDSKPAGLWLGPGLEACSVKLRLGLDSKHAGLGKTWNHCGMNQRSCGTDSHQGNSNRMVEYGRVPPSPNRC